MKRMMRTFWPRSKTCLGEKGIVIKDTEQRDSVTLDAVKCFLKR